MVGLMRRSDLDVLDAIIRTRGGFGHREHLELAWTYLRAYPVQEAERVMIAAIQHVAREHGAEGKYHETMTRAWVHFTAVHMQRWGAESFDEFMQRNHHLLDGRLIEHFYSRELIFGDSARAVWADPDLRPLPALA